MTTAALPDDGTVGIVGASLAGLSTARALRARGFAGRVVVVGDEPHLPYDRPPLSKGLLAGTVTDIGLLVEDETLAVEWRTGTAATALDGRAIVLDDGTALPCDGVVVATGARPRNPWPSAPAGVHTLRTLDDAIALKADLTPGARLVVVGAGFIGAEVASTARGLGLDVTIVEAAAAPLSRVLGDELGAVVSGLHARHGVRLLTNSAVTSLLGAERVTGVALADGTQLAADVVLLGLGVTPNVEWLAGSGLEVDDGVRCDAWGAASRPGVVAVGDCASWFDHELGAHRRVEHWSAARERAAVAVATLFSGGAERLAGRPHYFWSDQYGRTLQVTGRADAADEVTLEVGSVDELDFVAVGRRRGLPVAAVAMGRPREFMRWRKQLASASRERVAP